MPETILIINRWDDDFSRYDEYIDHRVHRVAYVTNPAGSQIVRRELACGLEIVPDITDRRAVIAAATRLAGAVGPFTRVLALSEFDLVTGALVREALGTPGAMPQQVRRFTDKVVMKQAILAAGLRAPRYLPLVEAPTAEALIDRLGLPLILKPRVGASSRGVSKVETAEQLATALRDIDPADYECEQYIAGDIYHVDGLVRDGELLFHSVSRYINTCLAFNDGVPLGSVLLEPSARRTALVAFTDAALRALELRSGAFHLEVIAGTGVGPGDELYFLEIGARVGGGEIPFLGQALFELDMMRAWVDVELGHDTEYLRAIDDNRLGGFLMIPEPRDVPASLVRVSSLAGKVDCLLKETLPPVGHVFDGKGGYEHISGRFLFAGGSSQEVETAIQSAIAQFSIETTRIRSAATG
ncbi:MAG TPA: ATP-grasp domain-containing protein [Kofleriaceae bacterium]